MTRSLACALLALLVTGCATPPRPSVPRPVQTAGSVDELAAAIAAAARRSDSESDSKMRAELAAEAGSDAEACLARDAHNVACLYGRAVAWGLDAKAHPTRAGELLKAMLASLDSAEAVNPHYDDAGPARVKALVLIRAPGWPLGPGDVDAGLVAARRAVTLSPEYPANLLALAEALAKSGDSNAARASYQRARDAAQALPSTAADRDAWLRQADEGLRRP